MVSSPTNNVFISRKIPKCPKMRNKPHYEVLEATENDNSYYDKDTEHTKYT